MNKEGYYLINRALAEASIPGRVSPVPGEGDNSPGVDIYTTAEVITEELRAALGAAGLLYSASAQEEEGRSEVKPKLWPGSVYYENCGCGDCPGSARHTFADKNHPDYRRT